MRLFFQTYGKGFPLFILHGLFGSSDNWHTLGKKLGEHFHVFALDQRNHGRSPHDSEHSYEAMANDLGEFYRTHKITSAHVLGHSMGGKTAMRFALDNPKMVKRLIVVDIAPKRYSPQHDHIFDALFGLDLSQHRSRGDIERTLIPDVASIATRQFLMKNLLRTDSGFKWKINVEALYRAYEAINEEISGPPFPHPALFMRSSQSGYIQDADIDGIQRLFPHASFEKFSTGHWIHAEAPEEFLRITLDFLKQNS